MQRYEIKNMTWKEKREYIDSALDCITEARKIEKQVGDIIEQLVYAVDTAHALYHGNHAPDAYLRTVGKDESFDGLDTFNQLLEKLTDVQGKLDTIEVSRPAIDF